MYLKSILSIITIFHSKKFHRNNILKSSIDFIKQFLKRHTVPISEILREIYEYEKWEKSNAV